MNLILSGAISNCPSAHLLVGATYFDLFYFSHNNNKEIWVAKTDAWKNMIVANCALKWRRESLLKQVMKWNETFVKKLAVKPWVLTVLVKYVEILYAVWHRVKSTYIAYVCTFHSCFFCFRSRFEVCVFEICLVRHSFNAHANRKIYQIGKTFVHNLGNQGISKTAFETKGYNWKHTSSKRKYPL